MNLVLDIETENTGADIMVDNKQIISVQIGDTSQQELYYANSKEPQSDLAHAKLRIQEIVANGDNLAGYNIQFDLIQLKEFLGLDIPTSNIFEITDIEAVLTLQSRTKKKRLEEVCSELGISTIHKQKMNDKAEVYKTRQDIIDLAHKESPKIVQRKGGTLDYAFQEALTKISGGTAIYDSYLEFIENGARKDSLFYEYAIGDVICEYRILELFGYAL